MEKLKYGLLKGINITGLTFLDPVVRLIWAEEPRVQLEKIGRFIVVPVVGILLAIAFWAYFAPKHKTKSGEVPTPWVTWDAAADIWNFHVKEGDKEDAYVMVGDDVDAELEAAQARLAEIEPLTVKAREQVEEAKVASQERLAEELAPLNEEYDALKAELDADRKDGQAALKEQGEALSSDPEARAEYLELLEENRDKADAGRDRLDELDAQRDLITGAPTPVIAAALRAQTMLAEERQYLEKKISILTSEGRDARIAGTAEQVEKAEARYLEAEGPQVYNAARQLVLARERAEAVEESTYAKPWTLPMQTKRSILCVFTGFAVGSLIAIPIGVLCGLSPTFMATMTPFIALFKPVSPIVWLPILLIIVGGFVPDPDKHWFIQWLWELPVLGKYKINPAFIASALTVAMCSLWATMTNTALGVASIDKDHLNVARVLQLGFFSRLTKIVLPSALPLIFAGLRISLGVGWMVLIAAELLSGSEGIGKFVWDQFNNGASDSFAKMFVVVFVVGAIGLLLDRIMIIFQRAVSFEGSVAAI